MKKMENKQVNAPNIDTELQMMNQELNERLDINGAENSSSEHKKLHIHEKKDSGKRRKFAGWVILGVFLLLIVGSVVTVFGLRWSGKQSLTGHEAVEDVEITAPDTVEVQEEGMLVSYNGKKYRRNEDIITILCMGIDREDLETEGIVTGESGQADTVFVVALDSSSGSVKLLNISRDSMIDVDLYNVNDEYVETSEMQLCLAYAYGDGKESSCENMKKSVSRLLYGMPIDAYAAIDLPAINVLNDAIGGVEVEVLEDLTLMDPALKQGATVLLQGNQAENYVRSREVEGEDAPIDSNNARMARQKQYLTNFIKKALEATKEDLTVPLTLYQAATSYMITDIGASEVTYLASLVLQGGFNAENIISIPGEVTLVDTHAQYHVDEAALYEIILDVFYEEVE